MLISYPHTNYGSISLCTLYTASTSHPAPHSLCVPSGSLLLFRVQPPPQACDVFQGALFVSPTQQSLTLMQLNVYVFCLSELVAMVGA